MTGFFRQGQNTKKPLFIGLGFIVIVIASAIIFFSNKTDDSKITIVLSPHYDDAALSLGGLLAKHEYHTVVATFFTAGPSAATTTPWDSIAGFSDSLATMPARSKENTDALKTLHVNEVKDYFYQDYQYRLSTTTDMELEMTKDIQALLAAYGTKPIAIYAPAIFTDTINHADHAMLHRAVVSVMENYPNSNVDFYFYEDFPYIERFNRESVISLEKNLENNTDRIFNRVDVLLDSSDLKAKERAIAQYESQVKAFASQNMDIAAHALEYTKNRCSNGQACEVVYKVFRADI
jgi:LmbE family N-acetylglucosaminyl deacetylase